MSRTLSKPMRIRPLCLAVSLLMGGSATLHAQSSATGAERPAAIRIADNSYFSLYGGPSDLSRTNSGLGNFSREDHGTAYGLAVGNYMPGQNWGMELGYTHFGQVNRAGGTTKAEGINLSVIGRLPINDNFNLLGRVGTMYGHTDVSTNSLSGVAQGSESGFDWSYGIGAELLINPQWSATLQYDEHYMKFAGNSADRITATTMGLRMRF